MRNDLCMDCGYFVGGRWGLEWYPPYGDPREPKIIPWNALLDDEENEQGEEDEIFLVMKK